MPPQGCNLAVPGDKLYSSATRKTYRRWPGCANSFLSLNLAIKKNTTYGNFTPLCFLVLFCRLQSKIARIQTVKTFRRANTVKSTSNPGPSPRRFSKWRIDGRRPWARLESRGTKSPKILEIFITWHFEKSQNKMAAKGKQNTGQRTL